MKEKEERKVAAAAIACGRQRVDRKKGEEGSS